MRRRCWYGALELNISDIYILVKLRGLYLATSPSHKALLELLRRVIQTFYSTPRKPSNCLQRGRLNIEFASHATINSRNESVSATTLQNFDFPIAQWPPPNNSNSVAIDCAMGSVARNVVIERPDLAPSQNAQWMVASPDQFGFTQSIAKRSDRFTISERKSPHDILVPRALRRKRSDDACATCGRGF